MKRLFLLAAAMVGLTLSLMAQQNQPRSAQQQVDTQSQEQSARSFEGKITKAGDKFVLQDSSTEQALQLDDQDRAKQFEGKSVKVTATMDPSTDMLHVVDIGPADRR